MNRVTTCTKCAIYNGIDCNLSPKLYATRKHDLTCPYFLTRDNRNQRTDALQQAVSLLQALFDLQNGPPTERRTGDWVEVMGQSVAFLGEMERAGVKATEIKPVGEVENGQSREGAFDCCGS